MSLLSIYHKRWYRLVFHFNPNYSSKHKLRSSSILEWIIDLIFYILDVFFIPDLLELLAVYMKPNTRFFNDKEKHLVYRYFGKSIKVENLRVNTKMTKVAQRNAHAFVTFRTVHFASYIAKEIFVHELVHIWQYQRFGSVYIYRALKAQQSKEGYNYGGAERLYHSMLEQKRFIDFNFEQQGEIFEDYARIIEYSDGNVSPLVLASYEYFVAQVQE